MQCELKLALDCALKLELALELPRRHNPNKRSGRRHRLLCALFCFVRLRQL